MKKMGYFLMLGETVNYQKVNLSTRPTVLFYVLVDFLMTSCTSWLFGKLTFPPLSKFLMINNLLMIESFFSKSACIYPASQRRRNKFYIKPWHLLESADCLELLLSRILFQVVQDSKHVGKPQGFDLQNSSTVRLNRSVGGSTYPG